MSNAMGTAIRSIFTLLLLVPLPCSAFAQERAWQLKKPSAWIKLCEKRAPAKDISVCMTLHERVDGQTGEILISAALRQVEGEDREYFRVMVPRTLAEQHVHATIFPEQTWKKKLRESLQKNEKLEQNSDDEPNLHSFSLGSLRCPGSQSLPTGAAGCIAEVEATPDLLVNLKNSGGLLVYATSVHCHCEVAFPISLAGFAEAIAGPPFDQWHARKPRIWPE